MIYTPGYYVHQWNLHYGDMIRPLYVSITITFLMDTVHTPTNVDRAAAYSSIRLQLLRYAPAHQVCHPI